MQIQLLFVTILFSLCLAAYDHEIRMEMGSTGRDEQLSPDIDLKDGEYGYKIYYDDGDYDFEDNNDQEEEETDGLCSLVNLTNKDIQYRNDKALEKMEKYMEIYVLANSLHDYAEFVNSKLDPTVFNLTKEVGDAVKSALRDHIDIEDLTYLYKTLVAIPDNYEKLRETEWKKYVIFQLESVKDYIGEHFQQFKKELAKLKTSRQFYKRRNFYVNLADRGGLMSMFYNWFDSRVCKPRMYDEAQIREQLKVHLKHVIELPEYFDAAKPAEDSGNGKSKKTILEGTGNGETTTEQPTGAKTPDAHHGEKTTEAHNADKTTEAQPDENTPEPQPGEKATDPPTGEKPTDAPPGEKPSGEKTDNHPLDLQPGETTTPQNNENPEPSR